ncbi:MAG: efflux RND transporter periplasmic adaptor subunit [Bacteroidetes bacterium]|nr:efflux RND transporter periplasmic adaptor subunit [Bacteroidota bacterium]
MNNKWIVAILFTGMSVSLTACSSSNANNSLDKQTNPIVVNVALPGGTDATNISLSGHIEAVQSANISTRMMGYISNIHVKIGDKVQKGQLLVSISNADILAKKSQAEAAVSQAEAAYENAHKDMDRYTALYKQQSASAKEYENVTLQYKSAKAAYDAARQMRNEANAQISYTNITAPFSGVITQKFMDAGNMANPGMPILAMETDHLLQVTASVPEYQIDKIKTGMEVQVSINAAAVTLPGKVTEVSSSSQSSGGMYVVKISIQEADTDHVLAGMYVTAVIPVDHATAQAPESKSILVPLSSLVHKGDLDGIYTVSSSNEALLRWVKLGKIFNDKVEILSGLSANEQFIVHAEGNLYNGVAVRIAR